MASFSQDWEKNIYSKNKQLNSYPYDLVVSIVARKFFSIPMPARKNVRMLDLGCGAGNNAKFLAENGFDVYGIDGSASAVDFCKKRFDNLGLSGNFVQGDFLDLPYNDNYFDLAVDRESVYANRIGHIRTIISQINKKLKPGGTFVSFIYSSFHPDRGLGQAIEANTYSNFKEGSSFYQAGIAHFADIKEVVELFNRFKIENIMRHSLSEIFDKPKRFMEFDEYIIIARK